MKDVIFNAVKSRNPLPGIRELTVVGAPPGLGGRRFRTGAEPPHTSGATSVTATKLSVRGKRMRMTADVFVPDHPALRCLSSKGVRRKRFGSVACQKELEL